MTQSSVLGIVFVRRRESKMKTSPHTESTKGVTMKTDGTKKSAGKAPRASQPHGAGARQDKPIVDGSVRKAFEMIEVVEEPPMSLMPRPRRLSWSYSLLSELDGKTMDDLVVEAGTKIAIEGTLDRLGYLYVVQIGDDHSVEVLFPPHGGSRRARPGTHIRLPSGTGWIVTTKKGKLRTITSPQPLTDAEIAAMV